MNLNNFTIKSQEAIQQAQQLAAAAGQQSIEPAHFLKGMLAVDENVLPFILKKANVNLNRVRNGLDTIVQSYPKVSGGNPYLSDDSNKLLQKAQGWLKPMGDEFVSLEHLLLAALAGKDQAAQLLKAEGLNEKDAKAAIL